MSIASLLTASILVMIPIAISNKEKLGLEKEIITSIFRAIIQLFIVAYILNLIFAMNQPLLIIILIFIMIINAAINTKKRGENIKNVFFISLIAITIGTTITMIVLVFSKAIDFKANEIIPIAGMIVSNAMVAINLSYRNLNNCFKAKRNEVEVKLSLGADIKEAASEILRESIKLSIIPTIDSAKTLGIVSLPGMMTGLIIAGASPMMAIKFQIIVTFMIISSSSVATMIATYLAYKSFFNDRKQLKMDYNMNI